MSGFNPSYKGLGELLVSPEMQAAMRQLAEKGKDAAVAISPVGPPSDPHRGAFKEAWEVDSGIREEPTRRAFGRITNPLDYSASVEFGNRHMQGQYVLTRAIDIIRE